jgi:hypothetical protein
VNEEVKDILEVCLGCSSIQSTRNDSNTVTLTLLMGVCLVPQTTLHVSATILSATSLRWWTRMTLVLKCIAWAVTASLDWRTALDH